MFNLQGSELVIVLLLALVVLGPEKLPDAMRKMGQAFAELKKMSAGFQNEFRSAIDEPMREIKDTANVLRDSADFTKLQSGERPEKPKSAEMAAADPTEVPTDDVPTFDSAPGDENEGPSLAANSEPAPFADDPPKVARPGRTEIPTPPPPFTGMKETPAAEPDDAAPTADGDPPPSDRPSVGDHPDVGHDDTSGRVAPMVPDAEPVDVEAESVAGSDPDQVAEHDGTGQRDDETDPPR